ncbi:hypothetical protein [Georgenia alba]|uniref:Uncharacterized protein n=1 Tax=Georgenia alba TaxID=2233858 RepID=A0ABW2Q6B9_9MICO
MTPRSAASRPVRARGLVESPLQLLSAVEAHAAGLGGAATTVHVRSDVPALDDARRELEQVGLPDGLDLVLSARRAALGWREPVELVGDAFSGLYQTAALPSAVPPAARLRRAERVVLLDDGLATLELVRVLTTDGAPLVRIGSAAGDVRRTLGTVAARQLRALARRGSLVLFTAMPLDTATTKQLVGRGVRVVPNRFTWLAGVDLPGTPDEPTVVVGSGMVADGLLDPDGYVRWVADLAASEPLRYFPHRRNDPSVLSRLAALPGVTVDAPGAPVELRLQGLRAGQRVVTLPSTSSVLLTRMLGPRGVRVDARDVPETWWTAAASPSLRQHLRSVLALAEAARAQGEQV